MKNQALTVAGIIFALVALVHLTRLFYHFPLVIGTTPVPLTANIIGFIVTALLSLWMFYATKQRS